MKGKFLLFFYLISVSYVFGQNNIRVSGTVKDASDQGPLIGVAVNVKGSTVATQTNVDGNFTIDVPANGTLVFSYIGYATKEVAVNNQTKIDVVLSSGLQELEQVVVIGYGTQRKRDVTGSITSIKGEDVAKSPNVNAVSSLQGRVAGLTIVNSGSPGAAPTVRIRGIGSTNSASPLYVVDGVHQSNIDYLNPADIESIEVLKDASSIAIFGLQAANGVIVVTTKRAQAGETRVTLSSSAGFQKIQNTIDVLNAEQFKTVYDKIRANAGAGSFDYTNYTADTDWQREILRTAFQTNHSLTVSNSGEKSTTLVNIGYNNQEGVLKFGGYQRYIARLNQETKITKNIKIGGDITGSHWNLNSSAGSLNEAIRAAPIVGIRESETAYYAMPSFQRAQVGNPVARIYQSDRNDINKGYRFVGSLFGEVKFLEKFTWRSQVYTDLGFNNSRGYTGLPFTQIYLGEGTNPTEYYNNPNSRTSVRQKAEEFRKFQQDHTLTYSNVINEDHSITGLLGFTTIFESSTSLDGSRTDTGLNIPDSPEFWYIGIANRDNPSNVNGGGSEKASVGVFARANYAYKNKYLLNTSIRRDGLSQIAPQNRWGTFGSVGLGWVVTGEDFFKNVKGIDFLKLRGAWGKIGNAQGITSNIFRPLLNTSGSGIFGDVIYPSVKPSYLPDPNLRWEIGRGIDFGLDLRALNSRLNADITYYDRKTIDIITTVNLPDITGVSDYRTNTGHISNKGIEVAIGWNDKITDDLRFSVAPNFSYNKNKVVSIGRDIDYLLTGNGGVNRTISGESVGHFYGYRQIGIYQTISQIENSPTPFANTLPGDIMYADLNNDGMITDADRENLGSPFPTWNFGLNLSLEYKNFDFLVQGQGVAGNYIYTQRKIVTFTDANFETNRLNAWDGAGTSNIEPILDKGRPNNFRFSTHYLEPGDYFRIRTLQLGYTLKPKNLSNAMVKGLRVYVSGQNIHTWSKVSGYTPEVPISSILGGGADNGVYPVPAVYTFGVNVTF